MDQQKFRYCCSVLFLRLLSALLRCCSALVLLQMFECASFIWEAYFLILWVLYPPPLPSGLPVLPPAGLCILRLCSAKFEFVSSRFLFLVLAFLFPLSFNKSDIFTNSPAETCKLIKVSKNIAAIMMRKNPVLLRWRERERGDDCMCFFASFLIKFNELCTNFCWFLADSTVLNLSLFSWHRSHTPHTGCVCVCVALM